MRHKQGRSVKQPLITAILNIFNRLVLTLHLTFWIRNPTSVGVSFDISNRELWNSDFLANALAWCKKMRHPVSVFSSSRFFPFWSWLGEPCTELNGFFICLHYSAFSTVLIIISHCIILSDQRHSNVLFLPLIVKHILTRFRNGFSQGCC